MRVSLRNASGWLQSSHQLVNIDEYRAAFNQLRAVALPRCNNIITHKKRAINPRYFPVLFCLFLSCIVLSCLFLLSCLVFPRLVLFVFTCLALPCLALPCLVLTDLPQSGLALSYRVFVWRVVLCDVYRTTLPRSFNQCHRRILYCEMCDKSRMFSIKYIIRKDIRVNRVFVEV